MEYFADKRAYKDQRQHKNGIIVSDCVVKPVTAGICRDEFGFCPGIFPAIQRSYRINRTIMFSLCVTSQERTLIRQSATGSAVDTSADSGIGHRQYCCDGSFYFSDQCFCNLS